MGETCSVASTVDWTAWSRASVRRGTSPESTAAKTSDSTPERLDKSSEGRKTGLSDSVEPVKHP